MARFVIKLPSKEEFEEQAIDGRTGNVSENKLQKLLGARGKRENRVLLLWLKAALNAVQEGIVDAETIFLPFFEDAQGNTVAEMVLPKMGKLLHGSAAKLLPSPQK